MESTEESAAHAAEVAAGLAVAEGALIAGPLQKRSDWLRAWNTRFCVLTTEQLAWHPGPANSRPSGGGTAWQQQQAALGGSGAWRCIVLGSGVTVSTGADGALALHASDARETLLFRGGSAAETEGWRAQLTALVETLQGEAKIARLHVRENAALFDARTFVEHPHIGSRNLRQRSLAKTYYACRLLNQKAEALLSLSRLPPPASSWGADEARAFGEILDALRRTEHPFLLVTARSPDASPFTAAALAPRCPPAARQRCFALRADPAPHPPPPTRSPHSARRSRRCTPS